MTLLRMRRVSRALTIQVAGTMYGRGWEIRYTEIGGVYRRLGGADMAVAAAEHYVLARHPTY